MVFNLRTFSFSESFEDDPTPPKSFSLEELQVATQNFSLNNLLGEGRFCQAYRGRLADGSLVAIKRALHADQQSEEWFEAEIKVGSTVSTHPNVLCLRGFCRTKKELLLVYPLMINYCLSYDLRERPDRFARPLNWTTRKRIALGAARGLAHLHNQGNIKIMHRNICASNILLNMHFEAKIGGFWFAIIMDERNVEEGTIEWPTCIPRWGRGVSFSSPVGENSAEFYVNTPIRGRPGFIAPEYLSTGKCTLKNDVFAYGKMLLELISGQLIYNFPTEVLDDKAFWPKDCIRKLKNEDQLGRVIDPNMQGNYVEEEAERLLRLALLCSHEDPSIRPEMSEVVQMLESQFLWRYPCTGTSWSQSDCDSTPYYSFPPSPSPSPSLRIVA
ncbi:hypothetical protein ACJRO7_007722 [Eucalyptus globulus]|uniref:Protein kinase domain-containing protein n=1 Tax=Eucalyptus globulus TaxID=34317 RepID=A0ABD3ILZ4_EUCGL